MENILKNILFSQHSLTEERKNFKQQQRNWPSSLLTESTALLPRGLWGWSPCRRCLRLRCSGTPLAVGSCPPSYTNALKSKRWDTNENGNFLQLTLDHLEQIKFTKLRYPDVSVYPFQNCDPTPSGIGCTCRQRSEYFIRDSHRLVNTF